MARDRMTSSGDGDVNSGQGVMARDRATSSGDGDVNSGQGGMAMHFIDQDDNVKHLARQDTVHYDSEIVKVTPLRNERLGNVFIGINPHSMSDVRDQYVESQGGTRGAEGHPCAGTTGTESDGGVSLGTSSQSSLSFDAYSEQIEIQERSETVLEIDKHTDFCSIESPRYKQRRRGRGRRWTYIQHYVTRGRHNADIEGTIGLQPLDELIKVNGKRLVNRKQRKVKKIFKKIKPNSKNEIRMTLVVRRWKPREAGSRGPVWDEVTEISIELVLTAIPAHRQERHTFKVADETVVETSERAIPPGAVDNIERRGEDGAYMDIPVQQSRILVSPDGLLESSCSEASVLRVERFVGNDVLPKPWTRDVYFARFALQENKVTLYLCSDISQGSNDLHFKLPGDDDDDENDAHIIGDERCFILRSIGSVFVLQSLLYRDNFVRFYRERGTFEMTTLDDSVLTAMRRGQPDESKLTGCIFQFSPVYTESLADRLKPHRLAERWNVSELFSRLFSCTGRR